MVADDLLIFANIVEAGSFTRAAELSGIPKSTLSRRLASLESELGGQLLQRTTRRLSLTELGISILEYAKNLQEQTNAALSLAQNRQISPKGTLRVSLPPEFHELSIVKVVSQYHSSFPAVKLFLDFSARRVDLLAERYDLALRVASKAANDSKLKYSKLLDLQNSLYASPDYIKTSGMPQTPDDLLKHTGLMLVAGSGETLPWALNNTDKFWTGVPDNVICANSMGLQRELCIAGKGIMGLTSFLAKGLVASGQLVKVLPDWSLPQSVLWCVTPGHRLLPQRTLEFTRILQTVVTTELLGY